MRLNLPRRHRHRDTGPTPVLVGEHRDDPPGTVRFETAWARRRFIPIEPLGDVVHFVAPRMRYWPGQDEQARAIPTLVTRGALPDTVTCGGGYIEVLAFVDSGIVVNEVRTRGDHVIVVAGSGLQPG